ncbi:3,4-dihydroxy-2-butanone 4-phosphate synthase [Fructobacillus pseudoficulneus]|uniref:3,4-dihydroxy-2-butanone 4-phosphate synthase n=1 Tax=Fructobacillus pseudoficulneus TaxID=220714 RepID=A0A3F3GQT4_9LACO|nr:3,4-dihydroxy-2-butanone-4-phosphate synthase [Fructobacillus pseudoficulneus]GAP02125.1 3,4-dihydroxy-2-butanone 4-phosphate synthase [Fructobacillus pseudoficulneus]SEH35801.1 3,4-dihydroxy-2-butanone 4-phosphate synthase [Fructobacillus pseudoficulneus]
MDKIVDALAVLKKGQPVIVVDNEDRENEGDLIALGENITAETVNFMVTKARGLLCAPMAPELAEKYGLKQMVADNHETNQTAFTVSLDGEHVSTGVTTGVSAFDRATTIKQLALADASEKDFVHPGHTFPLVAKAGGVLERNGHTEAGVDLAKLAGTAPIAAIIEILLPDGHMARQNDLVQLAKEWQLPMISIEELQAYLREQAAEEVEQIAE